MEKKRILIVDDEAAFGRAVKGTLERAGYEVRAETEPTLALEAAKQFRPDVILLDVVMPEMDGGSVAEQLLSDDTLNHIPVVFLTALVTKEEVSPEGGMIGGRLFLPKPVSLENLRQCIEQVSH